MSRFKLPKLGREPIRPDKEPGIDSKIWSPDWKCFCCHDSGVVMPHLAREVVPDYDHHRDKQPACYRCEAGTSCTGNENYDQRFNRLICNELDFLERQNWTATILEKQQRILDLKKLSASLAMPGTRDGRFANRQRHRTLADHSSAQMRHEEAKNADPAKLRAAAIEYLGEKWLEEGAS